MILPGDANLESIADEAFPERADEPIQSEVLNNQSRIEPGQDAVACAESRRESITKRDGTKSQQPDSARLVCLRILKIISPFSSARADTIARLFQCKRAVESFPESDKDPPLSTRCH